VVTGRLYENEPITPDKAVFIGRSIPAEGGNLDDMFITEAEVEIHDIGNDIVYPLEFVYEITGNTINLGYYEPSGQLLPQTGETYRLRAVIQDTLMKSTDSLWAETTVPENIEIEVDSLVFTADTLQTGWPQLIWENANIDHPLVIRAENDQQKSLYFKFYCLETWENARYIIDFGGNEYPEDEDEYEDPGSGFPRKIEYFNLYTPEFDDESGNYYVIDRGYKGAIVFYGRLSITIYNIDDNFYQYLYKPEGYNFGGIHNGIGYFGSVSGSTIYTEVVEE
jgi:hypothetical protein